MMDEDWDDETQTSVASSDAIGAAARDAGNEGKSKADEARQQLVNRLLKEHDAAKTHYSKSFERMDDDMQWALEGSAKNHPKSKYRANIIGKRVNDKVAALYAKNPKATAKRRERLDYAVWDGEEDSLQQAFQVVQMAQQMAQQAPAVLADPMAQQMGGPALQQAQAVLADYQQGKTRRQIADRVGKTLEMLFAYAMASQQVNFKQQMKQLVRRTCTNGVGYLKIDFQRVMGQNPEVTAKINDVTDQIDHLRALMEDIQDGEVMDYSAEVEELRLMLQNLQSEQEVVLREGLIFSFPDSKSVIVDPRCKNLRGFVGARWVSEEIYLSPKEIREIYNVDIGSSFTAYTTSDPQAAGTAIQSKNWSRTENQADGLACLVLRYDKPSGLMYTMVKGYKDFLTEPAAPPVKIDTFWPIFTLTFNEIEHPDRLFPPSDVSLMRDMQREYNDVRQASIEHRRANRPKYGVGKGMLDDADKEKLQNHPSNAVLELNALTNGQKVEDVLQPVKTVGYDPNLYDTNALLNDIGLVGGSTAADFGEVGKATATESSIAEGARSASTGSNVDDLDEFLSDMVRCGGQILLREMSAEQVMKIVGPGAVWPQLTAEDIADEIYLEIRAGSSGRPNRAAEIANMEKLLPFLLQIPGIRPEWLAREVLQRYDDNLDLTDAFADGVPAMVAMNAMQQLSASAAGAGQQALQGPQGGMRGPNGPQGAAAGPGGSAAPMGNNQV